ncbi:hypothetical protein DVH24_028659 [Malus domestica]|uniref:Reverse transcriptase Ty1/copia-type domain-containing protein n=1 Tax=Malus domestica TaxID=3750 RepID=A0A498IUZ0_MALDO|nr:hypothetical protein DVH24_028659 [Malus domestica]
MGKLTVLIIYVDDIIFTGDNKEEISRLKDYLTTEFEIKDLGGRKYFFSIEVARSRQGIFLSQMKYVLDLLAETRMLDCKLVDTPISKIITLPCILIRLQQTRTVTRGWLDVVFNYQIKISSQFLHTYNNKCSSSSSFLSLGVILKKFFLCP